MSPPSANDEDRGTSLVVLSQSVGCLEVKQCLIAEGLERATEDEDSGTMTHRDQQHTKRFLGRACAHARSDQERGTS